LLASQALSLQLTKPVSSSPCKHSQHISAAAEKVFFKKKGRLKALIMQG